MRKPKNKNFYGSLAEYKESQTKALSANARRKPKGIADDIYGIIQDMTAPWRGAPPGQNKSVTEAQGLVRELAEGADQIFAGGMLKASVQGDKALAKQAAINAAALSTGYVAGKAVQIGAGAVTNAYKAAKITSVKNSKRVPLFHGGPPVLKGGKIDPSITTPSTKKLNDWTIQVSIPQRIDRYRDKISFIESQLNMPNSFSARNRQDALQDIFKHKKSLRKLENFAKKVPTENYFTAVDDPTSTYSHHGAIHVINPKRTLVQSGFGPAGELQVLGKQKPVATVLYQQNHDPEAIKLAQQTADRLQKQNARKVLVKETVKNLRKETVKKLKKK